MWYKVINSECCDEKPSPSLIATDIVHCKSSLNYYPQSWAIEEKKTRLNKNITPEHIRPGDEQSPASNHVRL